MYLLFKNEARKTGESWWFISVGQGQQCFGSGFNQVSVSGSGSSRAKMAHKNRKKLKKFNVLKCWMFSFEG
jgi:hypothetical protein